MAEAEEIKLLGEFPPVSSEEWEKKIHEDLKGADYEKKLVWKPFDGLDVRPYYRMEDLQGLEYLNAMPAEYPFVRGNKTDNNDWEIRQEIVVTDAPEANRKALEAIARGAEAISFEVNRLAREEELTALLDNIDLEKTPVHFISSFSYSALAEILLAVLNKKGIDSKQVRGSFNFDCISYYLLNGEFYNSAEDNYNEAASLIKLVNEQLPQFKMININGNHYHNAGAHSVQELAWTLASASEYFVQLTGHGLTADEISGCMQLTFATGSDYFLEIAKIRAARLLWARMVEQYKNQKPESLKVFIHCINSFRSKTVFDPWVNILRSTTEAMSAAIGGADAITNLPMNKTYREPDTFGDRISRNTQILLKEESYLKKTVDPAAGSYYIENLTNRIAELAWDEFVKIEQMGGLMKALESGYIMQEIETTCAKRDMDIAMRRTPILGTNIFPNLEEEMIGEIKKDITHKKLKGIKLYRGAEAFEELRLATEKYEKDGNKRPSVLLIGYGNLAMRKARANFAANFFGVAGYKILEEFEAADVLHTLHHIMETDPEIIVYCSSDAEYSGLATAIGKASEKEPSIKAIQVVAGNPKELADSLKDAGISDFIHIRSNLLETLRSFNARLNIP